MTGRRVETAGMSLDLFGLDGEIGLITGAGSGFGRSIARAYAAAGAIVVCADIDLTAAEETVAQLSAAGGKAMAVRVDVTSESSIDAMMSMVAKDLGDPSVFVANAGISDVHGFIADVSLVEWNRIIECNLTGVFLSLRAAVRSMVPRRRGKIIAMASVIGVTGDFGLGSFAYSAAKAGVVTLVRSVAVQVAPHGICVNAIAPAFFAGTNIGGGRLLNSTDPDEDLARKRAEILHRTPLGRFGQLEDIQGISLFLATRASDYCTGSVYPVDGGWLAC